MSYPLLLSSTFVSRVQENVSLDSSVLGPVLWGEKHDPGRRATLHTEPQSGRQNVTIHFLHIEHARTLLLAKNKYLLLNCTA